MNESLPQIQMIAGILASGCLGISEVRQLLAYDWREMYVLLPRELAADLEVDRQFLLGMADEYDDNCWDGSHDASMLSRLKVRIEAAQMALGVAVGGAGLDQSESTTNLTS